MVCIISALRARTHTHTHLCTIMHTHTHTYAHTCTHTPMHKHAHTHTLMHKHAHTHTNLCTNMHTHTHTHTQKHTQTHICKTNTHTQKTHTHTQTHTHTKHTHTHKNTQTHATSIFWLRHGSLQSNQLPVGIWNNTPDPASCKHPTPTRVGLAYPCYCSVCDHPVSQTTTSWEEGDERATANNRAINNSATLSLLNDHNS